MNQMITFGPKFVTFKTAAISTRTRYTENMTDVVPTLQQLEPITWGEPLANHLAWFQSRGAQACQVVQEGNTKVPRGVEDGDAQTQ